MNGRAPLGVVCEECGSAAGLDVLLGGLNDEREGFAHIAQWFNSAIQHSGQLLTNLLCAERACALHKMCGTPIRRPDSDMHSSRILKSRR